MLLLYQVLPIKNFLNSVFTFHYASTLSHIIYLPFNFFVFTFHYASTLSLQKGVRGTKYSVFTFHYASTLSACPAPCTRLCADLHSTMLLLYRNWQYCATMRYLIYIPLCFYFIDLRLAGCVHWVLIYIPLCFYFIIG